METDPEPTDFSPPPEEDEEEEYGGRGRRKPVSNEDQGAIIQALKSHVTENNKLKKGAFKKVGRAFNVAPQSIGRIWKRGLESLEAGSTAMSAGNRKKQCGRKKIDRTEALQHLSTVPKHRKETIRSAASAAGIPTTSFHRMVKNGNQGRLQNVRVETKLDPDPNPGPYPRSRDLVLTWCCTLHTT